MRETEKTVVHTIDDEEKTFRIRKMDALEGSILLKFVIQKVVPLLQNVEDIFKEFDDVDVNEEGAVEKVAMQRTNDLLQFLPIALEKISNDELIDFEKRCLRRVDMMLPAGWQAVMTGDNFGVPAIQYDPMIALLLCYDVILFNFSGFFAGKGLSLPLRPQISSQ